MERLEGAYHMLCPHEKAQWICPRCAGCPDCCECTMDMFEDDNPPLVHRLSKEGAEALWKAKRRRQAQASK